MLILNIAYGDILVGAYTSLVSLIPSMDPRVFYALALFSTAFDCKTKRLIKNFLFPIYNL